MLKLVVNPGTEQVWEIPLAEGVTVLGSDPASEFAIAHGTVSPAHCEIQVTDAVAVVRDLGSAGGTFINEEPVANARLAPGQTLRLGGVALTLVSDAPGPGDPPVARRIPVSATAGTMVAASQVCKFHPRAAATWHCGHCRTNFCDLCVNVRRVGETARHLCRKCGNDCSPVEVRYVAPVVENFYKLLPGVFAYPLRGNGAVLMVAGTVVFLILGNIGRLSRFVPLYGMIFGLGFTVFAAGYMFNYFKNIVQSSARGEDLLPDWPDYSDWTTDILDPFKQMLALIVLWFGPAILIALVMLQYHLAPFGSWGTLPVWLDKYGGLIAMATLAVGALFAPMGMLMLAMFDSIAALNPVPIIQSILRIPLAYLVAAAVFELVLVAYVAVDRFAYLLGAPLLLTGLVTGFLELYAFTTGMRILGLLYRTNKERLGWFND